jgi:hypothetical protein
LHEAACILFSAAKPLLDEFLLFLEQSGFLSGQVLGQRLVANFNSQLADDAVGSLTVTRSVKE